MKIILMTISLLAFFIQGCAKEQNKLASPQVERKSTVIIIENPQLAKIILRPTQKELKVSKDPFKPIVSKSDEDYLSSEAGDEVGGIGKNALEDVILIGVAKLGDEFRAFMKIAEKSAVYKVGDKFGPYTVLSIEINKVVLKTPNNKRVLKLKGIENEKLQTV